MNAKYDVYSEFDIEKHKETFVNYLEVLIQEDGHVMYAVPSHQELAIMLACDARGWTRDELNSACPKEFYLDLLPWVLSLTKSISVWDRFYVGEANDAQIARLVELRNAGLYKGMI